MKINENDLKLIIQNVINKLEKPESKIEMQESLPDERAEQDGIFKEMNNAIEAAESAQIRLGKLSLEQRKEIIQNIRETIV
ncbi:MAG: aldehyde dehydrogenase EutE, partial [Candidatus Caldatribacteriota bacterium]|nr:aldehyde dehydrogenase EutE [Candidatus Caldatribacteriota bacterium]